MKVLGINDKCLNIAGHNLSTEAPIFSDMHFVYFANDFDGDEIPNKAPNSDMGSYKAAGTITKNGSGSNCYVSNDQEPANYLYIDLTDEQLRLMKGLDNVYTFYCRVYSQSWSTGGIFSWRYSNSSSYVFMIRNSNNQLQLHWYSGYNCGQNFFLSTDTVYKIMIKDNVLTATNLSTGDVASSSGNVERRMSNKMTSFAATAGGEAAGLDRIYALAGIARETTAEEDEQIKNYLMTQGG